MRKEIAELRALVRDEDSAIITPEDPIIVNRAKQQVAADKLAAMELPAEGNPNGKAE